MPYYSIVMVSIYRRQLWLLAQGLLQSVPSLQVSVTMPYYSIIMVSIYRRQLWLFARGLLQSVPSLQVSVAMLYYSIVMVSIGSLSTGSPSVSSFSSGECGNAILQYCYGFNIGVSSGS